MSAILLRWKHVHLLGKMSRIDSNKSLDYKLQYLSAAFKSESLNIYHFLMFILIPHVALNFKIITFNYLICLKVCIHLHPCTRIWAYITWIEFRKFVYFLKKYLKNFIELRGKVKLWIVLNIYFVNFVI